MQQAGSHINSRHKDLYAWRYTYRTKVSKGVAAAQTPDPLFSAATSHKQTPALPQRPYRDVPHLRQAHVTVPYWVSVHVAGASMLVAGFSHLWVQLLGCESVALTEVLNNVHVNWIYFHYFNIRNFFLFFFFLLFVICKFTIFEVTTQDSSTVMIHRYHIIWNDKKKWHVDV